MKKSGVIKAVITILIILLIVGVYYFFTTQRRTSVEDTVELTEIQKLITKNLDTNYPATPREVVKRYDLPDETECGGACQYLYFIDDGSGDGFYHPVYVSGSGRRPKAAVCT